MVSLLCHDVTNIQKYESKNENTFIDDLLVPFCPDIVSRQVFLRVLLSGSSAKEDIMERQEVLKIFLDKYELFSDMLIDSKNLVYSYNEYLNRKVLGFDPYQRKSNELQSSALFLSKILAILNHIRMTIAEMNVTKGFLGHLSCRLKQICEGSAYEELNDILRYLKNFYVEENNVNFHIELNDSGQLHSAELLIGNYKKKRNNSQVLLSDEEKVDILGNAYDGLISVLQKYIRELYNEFSLLQDELTFYKVSMRYCEYLKQRHINYYFPKIGECVDIKNLKDLFLISRTQAKNIVPNDFCFVGEKKGMIITGENGSGKTVYMRSAFIALLFGQAGLPIPADEAVISVHSDIIVEFAASDNHIDFGMGRFEKEAESLSEIVYKAKSGSIIFLNEIFQSTSYLEAESSLADILAYLMQKNVKWVLVTHLRNLPRFLPKDQIMCVKMENSEQVSHKIKLY